MQREFTAAVGLALVAASSSPPAVRALDGHRNGDRTTDFFGRFQRTVVMLKSLNTGWLPACVMITCSPVQGQDERRATQNENDAWVIYSDAPEDKGKARDVEYPKKDVGAVVVTSPSAQKKNAGIRFAIYSGEQSVGTGADYADPVSGPWDFVQIRPGTYRVKLCRNLGWAEEQETEIVVRAGYVTLVRLGTLRVTSNTHVHYRITPLFTGVPSLQRKEKAPSRYDVFPGKYTVSFNYLARQGEPVKCDVHPDKVTKVHLRLLMIAHRRQREQRFLGAIGT